MNPALALLIAWADPKGPTTQPLWQYVAMIDITQSMNTRDMLLPVPGGGDVKVLARELQDFVKQSIAPYKYPRAVEFVAALPRTETGKLQRFRLRQNS